MKDKKKAVVAGHICLDITPVFGESTDRLHEILMPGKLVHMKGVDVHTGGAVANTGIGIKILGTDVRLMGKIGCDHFGKIVLAILKEYGVSDGMILSSKVDTSYSIVLSLPNVDRIFLHSSGANDTFCYDDLNFEFIKEADLFHFGYPPVMRNMYINSGYELKRIFQRVKELGVVTSLDMCSIDSSSEVSFIDWKKILKDVLPFVDFFVPSFEEICFMLSREKYEDLKKRANNEEIINILSIEEDVKPLGDELLRLGAKVVLIKCGALGIYYKTSGANLLKEICEKFDLKIEEWKDKEGFELSFIPERVLSGTGAGDTSIAAFLAACLYGYSLEVCLKLATATGACCVSQYDALSGLKSFDELFKKMEKGWEKQYRKV